jgi:hypothetical protein
MQMSKSFRSINIFVSHPFVPNNGAYDLEKFRTNIMLLISKAENIVRKEYNDFELDVIYEFSDFQDGLPKQIRQSIQKSHFAIVDITENKPNIFYEYGLMKGLNVPALLIKTKESFDTFDLPADIKDEIAVSYSSFEELISKSVEKIVVLFKQLLNSEALYNVHLNKIWFNNNPQTIHVVTSAESEKREFASPESDNYMFLENLGDKDSLLEVMTFLTRNYRNVRLPMYAADEFKNQFEDNIVIIGGPGDEDGDGNSLCKLMMEKINSKISYSDDCEVLQHDGNEHRAKKINNKTSLDYGYFARFPNPFNSRSSVILMHGIHTFGVLGATKAFSDHPLAQDNIKTVLEKLKLDDIKQASFECFFKVDVLPHSVVCPKVSIDKIIPLDF